MHQALSKNTREAAQYNLRLRLRPRIMWEKEKCWGRDWWWRWWSGGVLEWWGSPDCPPKLQYGSVLFTEITLTERSEQSTTEWQTGTEVEPHQQARQPQSILIKQTSRDLYLFSFRECWQWNQRKVNYKIKSQKGRIGGGIKFKV